MGYLSNSCAFCGLEKLREVIDFGEVALAGAFLKPADFPNERKYRLRIAFCESCFAVQVVERVSPEILFKKYFYFSSAIGTLRDHFASYASEVIDRFLDDSARSVVVEIGCNDGVLLKPIADRGVQKVIGVDPAENVVASINDPRIQVVNDYFGVATANNIVDSEGKADLVLANNVFAHIEDINGVTAGVEHLLADNGVFVFEVHYLGKILEELQYDFIYHEHLYYYSLIALENHLGRHGMCVFDVQPIPIHGGSMRFYACKKSSARAKTISPAVETLRAAEREKGFARFERYIDFASQCNARREELMQLIDRIRTDGKRIMGYGASGRANTIIQYCGISPDHLECVIDDAPAKQGYFTPGSHLPIRGRNALAEQPEYVLVFAWAFHAEITEKCRDYIQRGGAFILPLPEVSIYPSDRSVL